MSEHDASREERDRAFEGLYRLHRADVYRAAMRLTHDHHEAEDVTQAAFLDAYRAVLRGTRPELPRAWLLAIAENVRRRRFAASLRRPRQTPLDDEATAAPARGNDDTEQILAALGSLPPNQRSAFVLREVAGLSYAEIATSLDVSLPAVQMLLFRARQGLRALLAPLEDKPSPLLSAHWLLWLTSRFEAASVSARALGAAGTAVVVLAGVSAASADNEPRPPSSRPAAPAASAVLAGVSDRPAGSPSIPAPMPSDPAPTRPTPARIVERDPVAPPVADSADPVADSASVADSADPVADSADPAVSDAVVDAGPAAPSASAPLAASGGDERPAPALVPTPTTLGPAELPVVIPSPQQVPVPVVEQPSVEGAEVPALDLPVVPVLPVEVGGAPPVLPGS
ncbi:MAG TPA: sigma-70 family RNA polymerase sigma factor [Gaiellaceae bacterium]|nr:sigma-70 family RNA polymerase sigma factor [Gaiellaceae bacterium]